MFNIVDADVHSSDIIHLSADRRNPFPPSGFAESSLGLGFELRAPRGARLVCKLAVSVARLSNHLRPYLELTTGRSEAQTGYTYDYT